METCRAIGCEPYLAADLRSLPARDFYQWIEYCNAPAGANPWPNSARKMAIRIHSMFSIGELGTKAGDAAAI